MRGASCWQPRVWWCWDKQQTTACCFCLPLLNDIFSQAQLLHSVADQTFRLLVPTKQNRNDDIHSRVGIYVSANAEAVRQFADTLNLTMPINSPPSQDDIEIKEGMTECSFYDLRKQPYSWSDYFHQPCLYLTPSFLSSLHLSVSTVN